MKPCACCGSTDVGDVIGVQRGMPDTQIIACVYNCSCGTTRLMEWGKTPEILRKEALLAETARMAANGWL